MFSFFLCYFLSGLWFFFFFSSSSFGRCLCNMSGRYWIWGGQVYWSHRVVNIWSYFLMWIFFSPENANLECLSMNGERSKSAELRRKERKKNELCCVLRIGVQYKNLLWNPLDAQSGRTYRENGVIFVCFPFNSIKLFFQVVNLMLVKYFFLFFFGGGWSGFWGFFSHFLCFFFWSRLPLCKFVARQTLKN